MEALTDAQKAQQQQMIMLQAQVMKQAEAQLKILGSCFTKCVPAMNSELADKEQECVYQCAARLIDTEQFVAKRLIGLGEKVKASGGA